MQSNPQAASPLNPLILIPLAGVILGIVLGLNSLSHLFPPIICGLSVLGIIVIVIMRGFRKRSITNSVDFPKIATINIVQYTPWLKDNVRGHDDIIDSLGTLLQQTLSLAKPGRTLGAYLFVGPTGTGKTFLAHLIAQAVYPGSEPIMLRMNQYKHESDVYTLIGPPPGMPGYEVGGSLTRPVLENPYRVIIIDEIEKCHRDVQHCFYDVLDAASCREKSSGKVVDFSGTIFFGTCNAGVEELRRLRDQTTDMATWSGKSRDVLSRAAGFDKAFLARWSEIYLMDELPAINVAEIACLQLAKRWAEYGIELTYTSPEVILNAVERNEEFKEYGVRQLRTFLQTKTDPSISVAKAQGLTKVVLTLDEIGDIIIAQA
jgi:ATP-dependent Clp protease ATP-binding subunit ClpC